MARKDKVIADQGLRFTELAGGQIGWAVGELVLSRALRFQQFQQAVIATAAPSLALLAARMIALDGVPPAALKYLEDQGVKPYLLDGHVAIEWIAPEPSRIERRLLSPMTLMAWPQSTNKDLLHLKGLVAALKKWLPSLGPHWAEDTARDALLGDQLCWLQEWVPGTLVGHLSSMAPLSALPRRTWARQVMRQPLLLETQDATSDSGVTGTLIQATLDAESEQYNHHVIQMAEDVFTTSMSLTIDGHIKRAWAMELGKLEGRLRRAHPAVALIIAWATHLCEAGTLETSNPAANTVKRYAKRAMGPLSAKLKALPPEIERWDGEQLSKIYGDLICQTNESSRGEMSAALGSFQAFLEEWFDIPPVSNPRGDWTPGKPTVRSNVIWDQEIARALELCDQCEDERLGQIANCCFLIAQENPVRIQDLLRLRICNLHAFRDDLGDALEIEVVRDAGRGRLKTETSQRRLWVRNPNSIKTIQEWKSSRIGEAAPLDALLFGERGNDRRVYRQAALHTFLNAVVKQVTGDLSMRFHHMRHSRISQELGALLSSVGTVDINRLEVLAADAGHSTPQTTLTVYGHIYEHALRMWLDLALMAQLSLTGGQAQACLGEKANTLVQAARRNHVSLLELVLNRSRSRVGKLKLESVSHGFEWGEVSQPHTAQARSVGITVAVIADAVVRLAAGAPAQQVAELLDVQLRVIEVFENQLKEWLQELAHKLYPRKTLKLKAGSLPALLANVGVDTTRMFSNRLAALSNYLSEQVPQQILSQAVQSWEKCGRGDQIAMGLEASIRGILTLLAASHIRTDTVRIAHQKPPQVSPQDAIAIHAATRVFTETLTLPPIVEIRDPRDDRPDIYLLISTQPDSARTSSAAVANGVLKAWLVACKAFLIFQDVQSEVAE